MVGKLKQSDVLSQEEVSKRFDAYIHSLDFSNVITY